MENEAIKKRFIASMTNTGLVYELLDRAVSDCRQAQLLLQKRDLDGVNRLLLHAQAIFGQLQDMIQEEDAASRRTHELLGLLVNTLFYANLEKDNDRIEEVRQIAQRLKTVYYANWEH